MIVLQAITLICIVLFILNQSVDSLTCHVCSPCEEPFNEDSNNRTKTVNDLGYYCVKVWTRYFVRREISQFCPEFHVASTGIWCCQTDLCNDGTRLISTISVFIGILINFVFK